VCVCVCVYVSIYLSIFHSTASGRNKVYGRIIETSYTVTSSPPPMPFYIVIYSIGFCLFSCRVAFAHISTIPGGWRHSEGRRLDEINTRHVWPTSAHCTAATDRITSVIVSPCNDNNVVAKTLGFIVQCTLYRLHFGAVQSFIVSHS